MDKYSCFSELAAHEKRREDYDLIIRPRVKSLVAVIAPHGGRIEPETTNIADRIAGTDFSLYCFNGLKQEENRFLHITSHRFDEPECLKLIASHQWVLAIHGCRGPDERIFLGGRDESLISDLASALKDVGISAETNGHSYPGKEALNICNRGLRNAGVQLELSLPFRRGDNVPLFIEVVRHVLMSRQNAM